MCRPGRRPLAGVEVFSKGGGWIFTSQLDGGGLGGVHGSAKQKNTAWSRWLRLPLRFIRTQLGHIHPAATAATVHFWLPGRWRR